MRIVAATAAIFLMGCATATTDDHVPDHGAGACNASRVQDLVGREASTELGTEAARRSGARALRWIQPGDMVTQDYRTDRLNIELDGRNRVSRLRCG
jgi:hypothetical protein